MDQETRWLTRYNEVKAFIETNHRNPSRHRIEEHDMLNWLKANRGKDESRGDEGGEMFNNKLNVVGGEVKEEESIPMIQL